MTFQDFSLVLQKIESTTSRNEITEYLADLFKELKPQEVDAACWLLLGRIVPPYEGLEFQFAEKMLMRAIERTYGHTLETISTDFKSTGDMATVVSRYAANSSASSTRSIEQVYAALTQIATENGQGSQDRKIELVSELFKSLDSLSAKFVVRILLTRLRLGFSDLTLLDALSWAKLGDKSARKSLEDAYQIKCDIGKLATQWMEKGYEGIASIDIEIGIPIQPALCQRLKTATEMIEKMGKIFAESKYDGTRVQIHLQPPTPSKEWTVRTFTRSLEESSAMFPELHQVSTIFGQHSLILDCEAIGYDQSTGKLLPFQETIQRKRKHDVELFSQQVPLKFFVFDVLFLDGNSLIHTPLVERKRILHDLFIQISGKDHPFIETETLITSDATELRLFHKKQLEAGLEGAVIKKFDSPYQPGRKGWSWVKFKEEENSQAKLSDTIDAVVLGYWYGKGKRNQFGLGAFLIGIAGPDERILTLSKVGTGLSDDQWRELKRRTESLVTVNQPASYIVNKGLIPDVWIDPEIIVEVAADELTKSPTHSAGLALRFPRLVRFRDDKKLDQITTQSELQSIR